MKRILILILLVVFSAQGLVVAVGENLNSANTALSIDQHTVALSSNTEGMNVEVPVFEGSTVSSDIEEMSDYVAIAVTNDDHAGGATSPVAAIYPFVSTNLPKALPPPRS